MRVAACTREPLKIWYVLSVADLVEESLLVQVPVHLAPKTYSEVIIILYLQFALDFLRKPKAPT
jgi:hypothetical protein